MTGRCAADHDIPSSEFALRVGTRVPLARLPGRLRPTRGCARTARIIPRRDVAGSAEAGHRPDQGADGAPEARSRAASLYSRGVRPWRSLNRREKCAWLVNPQP